jgi:hypothetical protein
MTAPTAAHRVTPEKTISTAKFRARLTSFFKPLLEATEPETRDFAADVVDTIVRAYACGGHREARRVLDDLGKLRKQRREAQTS